MSARCPRCDGPAVIGEERTALAHLTWCPRHPWALDPDIRREITAATAPKDRKATR